MTESESQSVLLSHLRIEDPCSSSVMADISHIADELGYFPLSLGQPGAFIANTHFTPQRYLEMLRARRDQLLAEQGKMKNPDKYEYTSIQAAWLISFERLSPTAKRLLWICAFLHHDGIPQTIFEYMVTGLDKYEEKYRRLLTDEERVAIGRLKEFREELLADGSWDEFKFHELISELQSFSLVLFSPEQRTWTIHPLVHEWAGRTFDADERTVMLQEVLILLSSARGRTDEERMFDGLLAVHVDEVLKGTVVAFSGCRNELGFIYEAAWRWDDEVVLRIGYKEVCEREFGRDDEDTLESMTDLADTYCNQGRFDDAATLELEVMETQKRKLGDDHLETLKSMANLAVTYHNQGRLEDAAMLGLRVMETRKRKLGDDRLETLQSMANLAVTYHHQGQLDDAAVLGFQAVEGLTQRLGTHHSQTCTAIQNLGAIHRDIQARNDKTANPNTSSIHSTVLVHPRAITNQIGSNTRYRGARGVRYFREMKRKLKERWASR